MIARLGRTREMFSHEFLSAMVTDFREHGRKTIGRVRAQRPEVYLKVCAMLLPREMNITPENLGSMSTEQLEQYLPTSQNLRPTFERGRREM